MVTAGVGRSRRGRRLVGRRGLTSDVSPTTIAAYIHTSPEEEVSSVCLRPGARDGVDGGLRARRVVRRLRHPPREGVAGVSGAVHSGGEGDGGGGAGRAQPGGGAAGGGVRPAGGRRGGAGGRRGEGG